MKSMLLSGVVAMGLVAAVSFGEDKKKEDKPTTKPVNKMCAVQQDHPIDDRVTYTHEGKTYGFCCEDCIPEFKKDPKKYADAK